MLAGAIPVVTPAGALPEVVGDTGVVVASAAAEPLAAGIADALAAGPERRRAARERVLREFSVDARRRGLLDLVDRALRSR
jgi:glycosyltransferase involved in cell wall biosynthesis